MHERALELNIPIPVRAVKRANGKMISATEKVFGLITEEFVKKEPLLMVIYLLNTT